MHKTKLQAEILMKKLLSTLILSFLLLFSASSFAETDNYLCSRYNKLKIKNVEKVLAVGIRRVYTSSVSVYVLGYGTPIKVSLNRIKLGSDEVSKRRVLKCCNEIVGQIRVYDLSNLGVKVGEFVIESGDKKVSTYIEIN
ncbi:MAG TPA: hypothetical protein OIL84_02835 [Succinivibrionaceae bacterium]|nr:hypothetical protein [Succinivibrionaceae bacterium]